MMGSIDNLLLKLIDYGKIVCVIVYIFIFIFGGFMVIASADGGYLDEGMAYREKYIGKVTPLTGDSKYISGKVILPDGKKAKEDIVISVHIQDDNNTPEDTNDDYMNDSEVTILKGNTSSHSFKMAVPEDGKGYLVSFSVLEGCPEGYLHLGYYNEKGTTSNKEWATLLEFKDGDKNNVNLSFVKGKTLSGTISLPDKRAASNDIELNIAAVSDNGTPFISDDDYYDNSNIKIPKGKSSVPYKITVMPERPYEISYTMTEPVDGFINTGYFGKTGATQDKCDAQLVKVGNSDINNIALDLVPGKRITGTISLPLGQVAPVGGIEVALYAATDNGTPVDYEDDYTSSIEVIIPQGGNSTKYSITVAPSKKAGYSLQYYLNTSNGLYLDNGYYKAKKVVVNRYQADLIVVGNNDKNGIDFTLLQGGIIKGTVSLPQGKHAPKEGITVNVSAFGGRETPDDYEDDYTTTTDVIIKEGKNAAEFSLCTVPNPKSGYLLEYYFNGIQVNANYLNNGYYCTTGTVINSENATLVYSNEGKETIIDISLAEGKIIKGSLHIPKDINVPEEGLNVDLSVQNNNGTQDNYQDDYNAWVQVNIPKGSHSGDFSVPVPANMQTGYIVQYNYYDFDHLSPEVLSYGYYHAKGMVYSYTDAQPVIVEDEDVEIDMVIEKGVKIQGVISLPQGTTAAQEGIWVNLYASADNGTPEFLYDDYFSDASVLIPQGKNAGVFTLLVPPVKASGYIIQYFARNMSNGYLINGYYKEDGISYIKRDATPLWVKDKDVKNIDMIISKGIKVSGRVLLPEGKVAGKGGVDVYIDTIPYDGKEVKEDYNPWTNVVISEGKNSVQYSLYIPSDIPYCIKYAIYAEDKHLVSEGYFNQSGTTKDITKAETVCIKEKEIQNIDIKLIYE